jgi:hypothetical protein
MRSCCRQSFLLPATARTAAAASSCRPSTSTVAAAVSAGLHDQSESFQIIGDWQRKSKSEGEMFRQDIAGGCQTIPRQSSSGKLPDTCPVQHALELPILLHVWSVRITQHTVNLSLRLGHGLRVVHQQVQRPSQRTACTARETATHNGQCSAAGGEGGALL